MKIEHVILGQKYHWHYRRPNQPVVVLTVKALTITRTGRVRVKILLPDEFTIWKPSAILPSNLTEIPNETRPA